MLENKIYKILLIKYIKNNIIYKKKQQKTKFIL